MNNALPEEHASGARLGVLSNNDGYLEDRLIKEGIRDLLDVVGAPPTKAL